MHSTTGKRTAAGIARPVCGLRQKGSCSEFSFMHPLREKERRYIVVRQDINRRRFYAVEAAMVVRVLVYNLFVLFRHEFLGKKEKRQRLRTLRYKYLVLPAQFGSDGREAVLRISARARKVRAKLSYLFARISHYLPTLDLNCIAVGSLETTEKGGGPKNRTRSGRFKCWHQKALIGLRDRCARRQTQFWG